jgi:hypothetical protein
MLLKTTRHLLANPQYNTRVGGFNSSVCFICGCVLNNIVSSSNLGRGHNAAKHNSRVHM